MKVLTRRERRGISQAISAARLSVAKHRVGAALFRGKTLIGIGWNTSKTHPESCGDANTMHAEFSCLIGQRRDQTAGTILYVVRLTRAGRVGISKPCNDCHRLILASGIKRVYYIDSDGEVSRLWKTH